MRKEFEREMWEIQECFSSLANRVLFMLESSRECLNSWDKEHGERIIREDTRVNAMEKRLERLAFDVLLRQQPVARDYRFLSAVVRFCGDYERIADQSKDICEIIVTSEAEVTGPLKDLLLQMYEEVKYMLKGATESIELQDEDLATLVTRHDDVVDSLYRKVREMCVDAIKHNSESETAIIDGLQIGKYLERVGDHSENIALWSSYVKSGEFPE